MDVGQADHGNLNPNNVLQRNVRDMKTNKSLFIVTHMHVHYMSFHFLTVCEVVYLVKY